jgi:hypothetical protein
VELCLHQSLDLIPLHCLIGLRVRCSIEGRNQQDEAFEVKNQGYHCEVLTRLWQMFEYRRGLLITTDKCSQFP